MDKILNKLSTLGIIPIVTIDDYKKAVPLAKAILASGINCIEITFRTSDALKSIELISSQVPDMIIGAGTITNTNQADTAINAGATFLVSPGLNIDVVKHCIGKNYFIIPGAITPTEIENAINMGIDVIKFFPAEAYGGINTIKSLSMPYPNMKFIPTGGINNSNINNYLSFEKVICCGGSYMIDKDFVDNNQFDKITNMCKDAISNVKR